jgi:hypothetical protein
MVDQIIKMSKTENNAAHKKGDKITALMNMAAWVRELIPERFCPAAALFLKQNCARVSSASVDIRKSNNLSVRFLLAVIFLIYYTTETRLFNPKLTGKPVGWMGGAGNPYPIPLPWWKAALG